MDIITIVILYAIVSVFVTSKRRAAHEGWYDASTIGVFWSICLAVWIIEKLYTTATRNPGKKEDSYEKS